MLRYTVVQFVLHLVCPAAVTPQAGRADRTRAEDEPWGETREGDGDAKAFKSEN